MKTALGVGVLLLGFSAFAHPAHAVVCANGVYRAGCAGPNGAAVVRKQPYGYNHRYGYHHYPYRPPASCASGPYRAGCAGPNGAAIIRKPF